MFYLVLANDVREDEFQFYVKIVKILSSEICGLESKKLRIRWHTIKLSNWKNSHVDSFHDFLGQVYFVDFKSFFDLLCGRGPMEFSLWILYSTAIKLFNALKMTSNFGKWRLWFLIEKFGFWWLEWSRIEMSNCSRRKLMKHVAEAVQINSVSIRLVSSSAFLSLGLFNEIRGGWQSYDSVWISTSEVLKSFQPVWIVMESCK